MDAVWIWLTTPPPAEGVLDPFGIVYLIVYGAGFAASAYYARPENTSVSSSPDPADGIEHWASIGLCVFGLGLFFFGVRALQVNPLSFGAPIWMVISIILLAAAGARLITWRRSTQSGSQSRSLSAQAGARRHAGGQ